MNYLLKLHDAFQKLVEKIFFRGATSAWSRRLAFMIENVFLMVVVFSLLLNTLLYNWTGSLYPPGSGMRLDVLFGGLDNYIPFVPEMAVFYVYIFYSSVIITMVFFAFVEPEKGYALSWTLVICNTVAILVYLVFPVSTEAYRAALLAHPRQDFWARVMYGVYASDTSFNCFPSLHAAVTSAAAYFWYRYAQARKNPLTVAVAVVAIVIAVGVVLSTLFVRQHYIADEIVGAALALTAGMLCVEGLWPKKDAKPGRTAVP
ncbi:MAG: phosphatase PAP2 family protein [Spirochaetales bacterium]|nr:phosphatase PAP2 family protein [Spirochaetales bacterium]